MSDLSGSELDRLVARLRESALQENPASAVKAVLQETLHDADQFKQTMPTFEENDVILFEDQSVSIWHCRFDPGHTVPPHDHQMTAVIGVYSGVECNLFFLSTTLHPALLRLASVNCRRDRCCKLHLRLFTRWLVPAKSLALVFTST